jgi:hypothetical protein
MRHSDFIHLFYRLLPFYAWKDSLLRRHIEKCRTCHAQLTNREEAGRLLIQAGDVDDGDGLWLAVSKKIREIRLSAASDATRAQVSGRGRPLKIGWRWAAAAAGLLLAIFFTYQAVRYFQTRPDQGGGELLAGESEQIQIGYIRITNKPAQAFIFRPYDSHMVIIWAGKNL